MRFSVDGLELAEKAYRSEKMVRRWIGTPHVTRPRSVNWPAVADKRRMVSTGTNTARLAINLRLRTI
jgi:hypothetical protein